MHSMPSLCLGLHPEGQQILSIYHYNLVAGEKIDLTWLLLLLHSLIFPESYYLPAENPSMVSHVNRIKSRLITLSYIVVHDHASTSQISALADTIYAFQPLPFALLLPNLEFYICLFCVWNIQTHTHTHHTTL